MIEQGEYKALNEYAVYTTVIDALMRAVYYGVSFSHCVLVRSSTGVLRVELSNKVKFGKKYICSCLGYYAYYCDEFDYIKKVKVDINMPSINSRIGPSVKDQGRLLKGSDLTADNKRAFVGIVLAVEDAPKTWNTPFIVHFDAEVVAGVNRWGMNVTNARFGASMISDTTDAWIGWGLRIVVYRAMNPKTGVMGESLKIIGVIPPKDVKKNRKNPPSITKAATADTFRQGGYTPDPTDEEVPY